MAIADTMRLAWRLMPDRLTLGFRNQTTPGVYEQTSVPNCWRRPGGLLEAENSQGVYCKDLEDWFIPRIIFPSQPTPGDVIRCPSVSWTGSPYYGKNGDYIILKEGVTEVGALGAWKCHTGKFFLQSGLTDTVSIYRPTPAVGAGGRNVNNMTTALLTNVAAKIQEVETFGVVPVTSFEDLGKMQIPNLARCYLSTPTRVQPHDWLIDQNANKWTVKNEVFVDLLGYLQAVDIERLPPGAT